MLLFFMHLTPVHFTPALLTLVGWQESDFMWGLGTRGGALQGAAIAALNRSNGRQQKFIYSLIPSTLKTSKKNDRCSGGEVCSDLYIGEAKQTTRQTHGPTTGG